MTGPCGNAAHRRIADDMHTFKRQRNAAQETVRRQAALLDEMRAEAIAARVGGRLASVEYFEMFVGIENVIDPAGRIDWGEVDTRVRALLAQRPELASVPDGS